MCRVMIALPRQEHLGQLQQQAPSDAGLHGSHCTELNPAEDPHCEESKDSTAACVCKQILGVMRPFMVHVKCEASLTKRKDTQAGGRFWRVGFGSFFVLRPVEKDSVTVPHYRRDLTDLCLGAVESVLVVQPKNALAREDCQVIKNIRVSIEYATSNDSMVWAELHDKVAQFKAQPWMAYTLFSVFGNVYYRLHSSSIECTALRDIKHVRALSRLVRNEKAGGTFESVTLFNFNVMRCLGRYVQVSVGGSMERMLWTLFGRTVQILPRTEDMNGVLYAVICNVADFITESRKRVHIQILGSEHTHAINRAMSATKMNHCRANLHMTYIGKVTLNYSWMHETPTVSNGDMETLQSDLVCITDVLLCILREMC